MKKNKIYLGDNLEVLKTFPDSSIDSIVTDPPYGINFMNKKWDYDIPSIELWKECLRVLKPGGHMLVACGTRTQHRMAYNIEEAGFVIRDIIAWLYGSGFPKSHDIGKGIESKLLNGKSNSRNLRKTEQDGDGESYQLKGRNNGIMGEDRTYDRKKFKPSTNQAKQYEGWGTALKPAMEMFTLVRKPLIGTVADNVLKYGTGGINIDGCRVEFNGDIPTASGLGRKKENHTSYSIPSLEDKWVENKNGRFPANLIHDGSEEVVNLFPNIGEESPARFFYTPKASQSERNEGLYEFDKKYTASAEFRPNHMEKATEGQSGNPYGRWQPKKNIHPTVKPIELMRYLVRLITPKGGLCLDPYVGSGTTAIACKQEKKEYIGIEIDEEYHSIAEARIKAAVVEYNMFDYL